MANLREGRTELPLMLAGPRTGSVGAAGLEGFKGGASLQSSWEQINVLEGRSALRLHAGCLPSGPALLLVSEPKTKLALYSCALCLWPASFLPQGHSHALVFADQAYMRGR